MGVELRVGKKPVVPAETLLPLTVYYENSSAGVLCLLRRRRACPARRGPRK